MMFFDTERAFTVVSETKVIMHRRINFRFFCKKLKDKIFKKKKSNSIYIFYGWIPAPEGIDFYYWVDEEGMISMSVDSEIKGLFENES